MAALSQPRNSPIPGSPTIRLPPPGRQSKVPLHPARSKQEAPPRFLPRSIPWAPPPSQATRSPMVPDSPIQQSQHAPISHHRPPAPPSTNRPNHITFNTPRRTPSPPTTSKPLHPNPSPLLAGLPSVTLRLGIVRLHFPNLQRNPLSVRHYLQPDGGRVDRPKPSANRQALLPKQQQGEVLVFKPRPFPHSEIPALLRPAHPPAKVLNCGTGSQSNHTDLYTRHNSQDSSNRATAREARAA